MSEIIDLKGIKRELRVDVVSDTHEKLSRELLQELQGADLIVHAGDACSQDDLKTLEAIAPIRFCLGNMDEASAYDKDFKKDVRFEVANVRFQVTHYREGLRPEEADVCIFGHTHIPSIAFKGDSLLMNPGSPTKPHSELGATIGRITLADGKALNPTIIRLNMSGSERELPFWQFL